MKIAKRPLGCCRLYGFVDMGYLQHCDPQEAMRRMIAGGIDVVQLRDKRGNEMETVKLAQQLKEIADTAGVWFIVNDSPWIAQKSGADGVHLGQEDLLVTSLTAAKDILGIHAVVGVSTHSLEQALDAERRRADYIAVGPVYQTATKPAAKPVGLNLVTEVVARVHTPVFAIGGINRSNICEVIRAGARAVAVVSDILCSEDVMSTTCELKKTVDSAATKAEGFTL